MNILEDDPKRNLSLQLLKHDMASFQIESPPDKKFALEKKTFCFKFKERFFGPFIQK